MVPDEGHGQSCIVLLHGFSLDGAHTWVFQAFSLASKYSVYIPDFMFFGGSTTDRPERSVAFQVECLVEALNRLEVAQCVVVGFSYGGFVCFELARTCPDLVRSIVVTGAAMTLTESVAADCFRRMANEHGIMLTKWSDLLLPESSEGVKRKFEIGTFKVHRLVTFNCILTQYLEVMSKNAKEKAELLEALVIPDAKDPNETPIIHQRVHLLWGEEDYIFTMEVAKSLKEKLGDKATLECIKGAGHFALLDRPFMYTHRLKKILASLVEVEDTM